MFYNSKRNAIILTPEMLDAGKSNATISRVREKNHGFITFAADGNPGRFWGRIESEDSLYAQTLTKKQVEALPSPLPAGVYLRDKKCGAVTRKIILGDRNMVLSVID